MRILVQRVTKAFVEINQHNIALIQNGLLVFLGVEEADEGADADWLANKLVNARIFSDESGKINWNITDVDGEILVVSQFTLHASVKKGNRPSFIMAANPEKANNLYLYFIDALKSILGDKIQHGEFGATMQVSLVNDGPFTLWYDSKNKI